MGHRGPGWLGELPVLRSRQRETAVLGRLLDAVRAGRSRALVVRGEAGVGKTTLLEYLVRQASGFRVAAAAGVQSEMEMAFAGLHQLCSPMLERVDRLPRPQQDALRTALGVSPGPSPDRFLVGLAVLGLLAEVARERPLLCVLDDAQWLDRASVQALAFAARRVQVESVGMVFATREHDDAQELAGLAELAVAGLPDGDARELLGAVLPGPVDELVRERIVAEARGNPLALRELPRGLSPAELAGGFAQTGVRKIPQRIEDSFRRQLAPLEAGTRRLLLVAAAEPLGDPVLMWRAAERLGIDAGAAAPATEAELLDIGARVWFRHPLLRSAVYRGASAAERRRVHQALAEVTDPEDEPDRRAWHTAQATAEPDEDVAAELERSAVRARARGGEAGAAAFLKRAAELTPEPARRGERALAAALAMHQAGSADAALGMLSVAGAAPLDKLQRVRLDLQRAQIALTTNRGRTAAPLLLQAARQLEPLDVRLARETYLDALLAAMFAGCWADRGGGAHEVAEAALLAPAGAARPSAADLLLDGMALRFTEGYAAGVPALRRAVRAFLSPELPAEGLRWLWLAHLAAGNLWDDATWDALADRHVELARETGALTTLPLALTSRIGTHVLVGDLSSAASLLQELEAVTAATKTPLAPYGALLLAAWRGQETETFDLVDATEVEARRRGEGFGLIMTAAAHALFHNSSGRYADALAAALPAAGHPPAMGVAPGNLLVEIVEAAARSGQTGQAVDALRRLTETTRAVGTDWALGVEARCRALLAEGEVAERDFRESVERLGRTRVRGEHARTRLLFGEWLRRERRRLDAREQLRAAHDMFTEMGMAVFAQRAARELAATGETARKRTVETGGELTPQEAQIVRLVREGLSTPEVAARLFISPRTVEWHLNKIFSKLGITSRRQLLR